MRKVEANDTVRVHYTGKLTTGEIFDSSADGEPLEFTMGKGMLIPGFEAGVLGMEVNDKKTVSIPPAQAYGEREDEMIYEVNKELLPEGSTPEIGTSFLTEGPEGQQIPLVVIEVKEETVMLDANHRLAGKELVFDLEVVEIL